MLLYPDAGAANFLRASVDADFHDVVLCAEHRRVPNRPGNAVQDTALLGQAPTRNLKRMALSLFQLGVRAMVYSG